jgi:hypothetical protein
VKVGSDANAGGKRVQLESAASSTGRNTLGCALTTGSSLLDGPLDDSEVVGTVERGRGDDVDGLALGCHGHHVTFSVPNAPVSTQPAPTRQ